MDIDWKHLATTEGYRSLKSAYVHDVQEASKQKHPMREKLELLNKFNWVINRAKHYSHHTGKTIEEVLNEWESKRNYWWLNYYQDGCQPKFRTRNIKPLGVNGMRKQYKKMYRHDPAKARERMKAYLAYETKNSPKKEKPRWTMQRKRRYRVCKSVT